MIYNGLGEIMKFDAAAEAGLLSVRLRVGGG